MRSVPIAVALLLTLTAPGAAQDWELYTNVEDGFKVNFPGQPKVTEITWTSQLNFELPGRVYSAERGRERYSLTVVDYSSIAQQGVERGKTCPPGNENCRANAPDALGAGYAHHDERGAIVFATFKLLQRDARLDSLTWDWQDLVEGHTIQLTNNADQSRTFAWVGMHAEKLYILEGTVPEGYPEPGLFQQSMGWVDKDGNGIRYQSIYSNSFHGMGVYPVPPRAGRGGGAGVQVPTFRVDPAWPAIPNGWQFGQVASVSVDADDHVWVLQRPGTLGPDEKAKAAPPVVEFTADGTFVRGWGGPGAGYEWPNSEHGIHVDGSGFVWISGNGESDHQILKFTKDGRFVMQIGRAGRSRGNSDTTNLNQPADVFVHAATGELFVADGYGNRRIIVFDAATGAYKRMWGAFGSVPTDEAPNPAPADADPRGAPQFVQPVHAARVSRDGLVYVSDRGGKRVQVFRLDGTYVAQVFIGRECRAPECGNGTTAASTAFSSDPEQRFLYVGNRSQAKVMIFDRRTLELLGSFGEWGSNPGQFGTLHHMSSDSSGNLYVTEVTPLRPENRRVQKFLLTRPEP